jgi:dihydroorotate dehydrogenase
MYSHLFRPLLFRLDPESAHRLTINLLRLAGALPLAPAFLQWLFRPAYPGPEVKAFGLTFANPVGLAAGYDKEGKALKGLASLGFGHLEMGTVTPKAQPGNPFPRLFRIPKEKAVINRMGFPNRGAAAMAANLRRRKRDYILGINLGKNKAIPLEEAGRDYCNLIQTFAPLADYLAINVSSPNTPGLRQLQSRRFLEGLLSDVAGQRGNEVVNLHHPLPVLVKVAPDLTWAELDDALTAILDTGMDGIIATNTTTARDRLVSSVGKEEGGLSGLPLKERSTAVIRYINQHTEGKLPIIGVGGIMSAQDALEKLEAGAVLVQVYTGMIYAGPGLVRDILNCLCTA